MNTFIVVSLEVLNETLPMKHFIEILSISAHKICFGAKSTFLESSHVLVVLNVFMYYTPPQFLPH